MKNIMNTEWISVDNILPQEGKYVIVSMQGKIDIARIEIGISKEEREKMKSGELPDKEEFGYVPGKPVFTIKRSDVIKGCDQWGNNCVPYKWYAQSGPMQWFGQCVTHWMPLPEPPEN